jgi:hypothetical protein
MILPDIGEIEKPGEGDESGAVGETKEDGSKEVSHWNRVT